MDDLIIIGGESEALDLMDKILGNVQNVILIILTETQHLPPTANIYLDNWTKERQISDLQCLSCV